MEKRKSFFQVDEPLQHSKSEFEILASISVEICCDLLLQLQTDYHPRSHQYTLVEIQRVDDTLFTFEIVQKQNRNITVVGKGSLIGQAEHETLVTGKVQLSGGTWTSIITLMLVILIGFFLLEFEDRFVFFIVLAALTIHWFQLWKARQALKKLLIEVLSK